MHQFEMTQEDRRIRRSKKLLSQALIELTLEKNYEEITIQDITDRADVGYRTFFRHYADKDELLKDTLATTMLELRELIGPPTPDMFIVPGFDVLEETYGVILFEHIQKHSDLYRVLLRSERSVIESLIAFAIEEFKANFAPLTQSDIPAEIVANHLVSATFALVRWWLDQGMPYPPEKMGEYHARLIIKPMREMIMKTGCKPV
ncbi:MAG: TetR/AcrR family transcriptional regulator [Anaerolineales bacterium]